MLLQRHTWCIEPFSASLCVLY